jgi:hypothetical protein
MASLLVRVELYAATAEDYTLLRAQLGRIGYATNWRIGRQTFQLPTGMYFKAEGSLTLELAFAEVAETSRSIGFPPDPYPSRGLPAPRRSAIAIIDAPRAIQGGLRIT